MGNYQKTLDWMFAQLPMYQKQGKTAFKKDLRNIVAFAKELHYPEKKIKTIHVAGTNGKGSTSHMISSILQEAGYKVGLYTSPHLKNFTERIRINGEEITQENVVRFISKHKKFLEQQKLSFFEMTVGLAFYSFAQENVDIAVIEVGMGGRLDSTNIITPEVSVITNIGFDHMQFLGETLLEIASEKSGIIKKNVPVVIGEKQDKIASFFEQKAKKMHAPLVFASNLENHYKTDLLGDYQKHNIKTAVVAIKELQQDFLVSEKNISKGLLNVVKNTNLMGRWQILNQNPKVICDTAHNKDGLKYVLSQLKKETYNQLHIVLGMVKDKNVEDILLLFPKRAMYYFCKPSIFRGLPQQELELKAKEVGLVGKQFQSVSKAYKGALLKASPSDLIYIGGSNFVVAEVLD